MQLANRRGVGMNSKPRLKGGRDVVLNTDSHRNDSDFGYRWDNTVSGSHT